MIITISIGGEGETSSGYAELLEHSWVQSGQQGDLLRLMPVDPSSPPQPGHLLSFCESTLDWESHPYLDDIYQGYNLPGAVLQWLLNAPHPVLPVKGNPARPPSGNISPHRVCIRDVISSSGSSWLISSGQEQSAKSVFSAVKPNP